MRPGWRVITFNLGAAMRDFERVCRACEILCHYVKDPSDPRRLHAEHDTLFLCFPVPPDALIPMHKGELAVMRVTYNGESWQMNCSA